MYRGRYEGKHRKATAAPVHGKTLRTGRLTTMVIATVLLLALAIGGTLAWLSTKDSPIQNKFLPPKVTCEVTERFDGSRGVKSNVNVKNTGTINQYVRVSVYKYWLDADGNKMQNVSPDLIDLHLTENGWIVDENSSTPERTVLYYSKLLNSGETSKAFADTLSIDPQVATKVTQTTATENGYTTITTTYDYDGLQFCVEASVDAVQEHNAEDAILSAWGRKVSISNGSLSLN